MSLNGEKPIPKKSRTLGQEWRLTQSTATYALQLDPWLMQNGTLLAAADVSAAKLYVL